MAIGICKIKDGWVTQDSVRVRYTDGKEMEIPADQYNAQGYRPPIEHLPWCSALEGKV